MWRLGVARENRVRKGRWLLRQGLELKQEPGRGQLGWVLQEVSPGHAHTVRRATGGVEYDAS